MRLGSRSLGNSAMGSNWFEVAAGEGFDDSPFVVRRAAQGQVLYGILAAAGERQPSFGRAFRASDCIRLPNPARHCSRSS
jgi:hypothetical protein